MLEWMLGERGDKPPTQIARFQNRPDLRSPANFEKLIRLLSAEQGGSLWCINLGEHEFSVEQLGKLRQALSEPTCMITHMFIDPGKLPQQYAESTSPNEQLLETQEGTRHEKGNQWKKILMALLRVNRKSTVASSSQMTKCRTPS